MAAGDVITTELTEDALQEAISNFKDAAGLPLKVSTIFGGGRAVLRAKRILAPSGTDIFPTVPLAMTVEIDPYLGPDHWRLA